MDVLARHVQIINKKQLRKNKKGCFYRKLGHATQIALAERLGVFPIYHNGSRDLDVAEGGGYVYVIGCGMLRRVFGIFGSIRAGSRCS